MLTKKMIRDIRLHITQFITVFLMVFLGMFIFSGIRSYMDGMEISRSNYYKKNNVLDLQVQKQSVSDSDFKEVENIAQVTSAERKLTVVGTEMDSDHTLQVNFIERNEISKFHLVKGGAFSYEKDGIWVDSYYAKNNALSLGDTMNIKIQDQSISKKIVGLIMVPDHIYDIKDESQVFSNHKDYGFVYMSAKALPTPVFSTIMVKLEKGADADMVKEKIESVLPEALAVLKLEDLPSHSVYQGEIEEGQTYVGIFSGMFLFIAMLSVVTTMHRIVKKQRVQIGTLKALGFRDRKVLLHYISYGFWISLAGAISGVLCGPLALGRFFMSMEMDMFEVPNYKSIITAPSWFVMIAVVACVVLISYLSARKELKHNPADTLRIQPSQTGDKNSTSSHHCDSPKMGFSTRWNLRDMKRNRMRTLMGFAGIAGCCMLLVCAFGLLDTLNDYVHWQFRDLYHFETKLTLSENISQNDKDNLTAAYGDHTSMTLPIEFEKGSKKEANSIMVTDAGDKLRFTNHNRSFMTLKDGGIYLTEKLAKTLNVTTGSEVRFHILGSRTYYRMKVLGLTRDPQSQTASMTKSSMESLGLTYSMDTLYTASAIAANQNLSGIESIQSRDSLQESMESMISTMRMMVMIIIAAAAILGSVILYNLGILSFHEKQYQFATMKVLGFRDERIRAVFLLQNIWITTAAIIAGLPLGYYMTDFIYRSALSDSFDFSARIRPVSYLFAAFGTFLVSSLVNRFLSRKIVSIDMVSSLKGSE